MNRLKFTGAMVLALMISGTLYAHHSSANIDTTKSVNIEGTVKQFKWGNPHAWLEIEVTNQNGKIELWNLEMTSPSQLVGAGWKATSIKAGEKVKAVARPMKSGDPGGLFVSVTLPTGQTLTQQSAGAARGAAPAPAPAPAK